MSKIVGYDTNRERRATCEECTAIIQYAKREVKICHYKDYDGGSDSYSYITCPNCQNHVKVKVWY